MVYWNLRHAHLLAFKFWETINFFNFFSSMIDFMTNFQGKFHNKQTPPSNSLKSREFETCYIKSDPPHFFYQQNMQWSRNMVHSHFKLWLRAHDYIKCWLSQHPWYGLWMRVKGPHHYKVTALGSWPNIIHFKPTFYRTFSPSTVVISRNVHSHDDINKAGSLAVCTTRFLRWFVSWCMGN